MSLTTRRIPAREWEKWKSTILSLITHNTLKEVMTVMVHTHGFKASKSQYEEHLRAWKAGKYISQDAWAVVFNAFDKLRFQDKEGRILVDGKLDEPKTRRARRTYDRTESTIQSGRIAKGLLTEFKRLSIETKGADGEWCPYDIHDLSFSHNATQGGASSLSSLRIAGNSFGGARFNVLENASCQAIAENSFFGEETRQNQDIFTSPSIPDLEMEMVNELTPAINTLQASSFTASIQLFSPRDLQHSDSINNELSFPDLMGWTPIDDMTTDWMNATPGVSSMLIEECFSTKGLPFNRFINDLPPHGISLSLGGTRSLLKNAVQKFLADIASSMSETTHNWNLSNPNKFVVNNLMSALKGLLPSESLQVNWQTRQSLTMDVEMVQSKLNQILLFSAANGFAGLQEIPIQSVLKYLSRHGAISFQSQGKHRHIERALAENLFRAAIKARDKHLLKIILAIGSVNVNDTVCDVNDTVYDVNDTVYTVNGGRYTPLELAAYLGDLGTVQLLIDAGADVNKTFYHDASQGGALARFLNRLDLVTPVSFQIAKILFEAGAELHVETVKGVLKHVQSTEFAYYIASNVQGADHAAFIRQGLLTTVAKYLKDWQAFKVFTNMTMACERTNCQRCLTDYKNELDWAYVQSAKQGHLQVLQQLQILYKTPHRAFSADIRSDRKEVIEFIRTLSPDLNTSAHTINKEEFFNTRNTTSLAEGIRAGNKEVLSMMEDAGCLSHLRAGGRFEPAISAASEMSNIEYVRKLLKYHPSPKPSFMGYAVLQAVEKENEEILFALLKMGADVNWYIPGQLDSSPLVVAIHRRNRRMVHAILNANVHLASESDTYEPKYTGKLEPCSILGKAIKWADISIIQAILSTLPNARLKHGSEVFQVLEQGDMEFFEYLQDSGVITASVLTDCLEVALKMCDAKLTRTLVEKGADPRDQRILALCAERSPEMLQLFLELASLQIPRLVVPGFGTDALGVAIRRGKSGLESVRVLLDSGVVDAKSFRSRNPFIFGISGREKLFRRGMPSGRETPLGSAIKLSRDRTDANFDIIRKLLEQGRCDPNSIVTYDDTYNTKQTALLEAIETRDTDLVELLINHQANVNHEAQYGLKRTPLQKAVELQSLELTTLLLEAGAEVNGKPATRGGATALQLAAITGNCNIAAMLLKWGADVYASPADVNGRWPLEGAAEHGRIDMIFFLWRASGGFDLDLCRSAMKLAEENGYLACKDAIEELASASGANIPAITI